MAQNLLDNRFASEWTQLRGSLRDKWRNLTEEDVNQINGNYDLLVSKLQQRYGYSRDQAEEQIQNWVSEKSANRFSNQERPASASRPVRHEENFDRRADNSSFWKWVFGLGIPLLLLGTYFNMNHDARDARVNDARMNDARVNDATVPATGLINDQTITNNIRSTLSNNAILARNIDALRISSNNGVVTLSGTVATNEERDLIVSTTRNVTGVNQVINQITVR